MSFMKNSLIKSIFTIGLFLVVAIPYTLTTIEHSNEREIEKIEKRKAQEKADAEKKTYLLGKFDQSTRKDFVAISKSHSMSSNAMYLRKETYAAFIEMRTAALKDGVTLNIASATRNFNYQKELWEKKWTGLTLVEGKKLPISTPDEIERFQKILEYSAAPSTSRHHWGTDIDINGAEVAYFNTQTGKKVYAWLSVHASEYGFCQPYNEKGENRPNGYNEEKWHWSYLPLAKDFTKEYKRLVKETDITGFMGDAHVKDLNLIENYVLGINSECL